jgi:hypothetical protein
MAYFLERNVALPRRLLEELFDRVDDLYRGYPAASGMRGDRLSKPSIEIGPGPFCGYHTGLVLHGGTPSLGEFMSFQHLRSLKLDHNI